MGPQPLPHSHSLQSGYMSDSQKIPEMNDIDVDNSDRDAVAPVISSGIHKTGQMRSKFVPSEEKFPYFELGILFFASFTSAIPLVGLFPYVAFMVVDIGAANSIDEAGYVSGYLASSFMFGRIVSSFYWGYVADKAGRLPVAYISCAAIILFSVSFGLSVNIWMAAASRFALGVLNPFNTLTKTLISDICCKKHQPMGMSLATGSWSVGLVIGPALGGALARPCTLYPDAFGGMTLFETFPYLLPNLVTAGMALVSMVLLYLYLPETAPVYEIVRVPITVDPSRRGDVESNTESDSKCDPDDELYTEELVDTRLGLLPVLFVSNPDGSGESLLKSAFDLFNVSKVKRVCTGYFAISVTSIIFDEVFPLWAQASEESGGLHMTGLEIGKIGSMSGVPMLFTTFFLFPLISKKYGAVICFRYGQLCSTIFTLSVVSVRMAQVSSSWIIPLLTIFSSASRSFATVAFASIFILTNSSVTAEQRGAVNGLSMTIGGVAKAFGPVAGSIIFAWSINNGVKMAPFNYTLVFFLCLCIGILTFFLRLEDDEGNGGNEGDAARTEKPGGGHVGQLGSGASASTHGLISSYSAEQESDDFSCDHVEMVTAVAPAMDKLGLTGHNGESSTRAFLNPVFGAARSTDHDSATYSRVSTSSYETTETVL
jgi:MFS family permease